MADRQRAVVVSTVAESGFDVALAAWRHPDAGKIPADIAIYPLAGPRDRSGRAPCSSP
ncbi:MAG TPA: hypothetical protein VMU06_08580 [Stellaceae bacterium]|nr:hypothetical protein [Stellaceae bacterium]